MKFFKVIGLVVALVSFNATAAFWITTDDKGCIEDTESNKEKVQKSLVKMYLNNGVNSEEQAKLLATEAMKMISLAEVCLTKDRLKEWETAKY